MKMKFTARRVGVLGVVALTSLALTGQTGATQTVPADPPTPAASPTTPELSSKQFGNWSVTCRNTPAAMAEATAEAKTDKAKPPQMQCEMSQVLNQTETGKRVLTLSLQKRKDTTILVMLTPFGLDLSKEVQLRNADKLLQGAAFKTCYPAGCVTETEMSREVLGKLSKTGSLTVALPRLDNDKPLELTFPNNGFGPALSDLMAE